MTLSPNTQSCCDGSLGFSGPGTIAEDLQTAARVVEMLLIKDHTRIQDLTDFPYDSTHAQQHRLLSISHPDECETASEELKSGAYIEGFGDS